MFDAEESRKLYKPALIEHVVYCELWGQIATFICVLYVFPLSLRSLYYDNDNVDNAIYF